MKLVPILAAAVALTVVPGALAQCSCCGGGTGSAANAAASPQTLAVRQVFAQPVQSVFDNYIKIQGVLAQDSIEGLSDTTSAIAKAIRESRKAIPSKVAEQAEAVGKAKDLESARTAFKDLSDSLIAYLKKQRVPAGAYYVAYCPMAKASWIQTDKTIINPYMGKGMLNCGQIKG